MSERQPRKSSQKRGLTFPPRKQKEVDEHADDFDDDERDIVNGVRIMPASQFRLVAFAEKNVNAFIEYADYRALGHSPERSFLRTFGTAYADVWLLDRIEALEHNLVYRRIFAERFGKLQMNEMWDQKISTYELLCLVGNPGVRDTVRASAIKELNVMYGITAVDDKGHSRAGKGLAEFYQNTPLSETAQSAAVTARHPEPGSSEADAFVEANSAGAKTA